MVAEGAGKRRCFRSFGQVYYGDVEEDQDGSCTRHGQGLQIITAETVTGECVTWGRYQGTWAHGAITGSGIYRWSDGSVYEGCFLNGKPHGHGRLSWPEGSVYDGSWIEGELHGQGTFYCGFGKLESHGVFRRNCQLQHDGTWVDVVRRRDQRRLASLQIGAVPEKEVDFAVLRCTANDVHSCVDDVLRRPPYLIPLVVATASCSSSGKSSSPSPLWCLEEGEHGCSAATTVHLAHAADQQRRKRDFAPRFRSAIREALLTSRAFGLVFGDDAHPGNPQEDEVEPAPATWSLGHFFDRLALPLDIFDLRNFHGSGMADLFLPSEKKGLHTGDLPNKVHSDGDEEHEAAHPAMSPPPTIHLLQVVLVSLKPLADGLSDEAVRDHIIRRFAAILPLHRVSIIVVSGE